MLKAAAGFILLCGLLGACKNGEKEKQIGPGSSSPGISGHFKEGKLPYQLTDTGLLNNKDTSSLPQELVNPLIPDSIANGFFGKNTPVSYTALAKFSQKGKENYLVVKAHSRAKTAALLLVTDNQDKFLTTYPLLLPDEDPSTSQVSAIDKNYTITKNITRKSRSEILGEGKEVLAFDAATKTISLVMFDPLDDNPSELVNPIDTFSRTNKLAGDYRLDKKSLISVRDGRYANQLLVFIHTESESGDCRGQMKGEFLLTSPNTAVYRQGGDPCVLSLSFKGNNVSINEERGCGNYRGLDCPFSGTFTRKKPQAVKPGSVKPKRK